MIYFAKTFLVLGNGHRLKVVLCEHLPHDIVNASHPGAGLDPDFLSNEAPSEIGTWGSMYNLTSTILGAGLLSLPSR